MKVLLSTYNGEAWLDELLQSVRDQTYTDWTMLVRDDASNDRTVEIVRAHAKADPRIQLVARQSPGGTPAPLGAAGSFFSLLGHVEADEPFAFCDQDDVWFPHKLEWSLDALDKLEHPVAAVATDAEVGGANLEPIGPSALQLHGFRDTDDLLGRLLVNNVVIGAAMVGTGELAALARRLHPTRSITDPAFHDWWCALVAAYAGELMILPAPTMAWRRHVATVTGKTPAGTARRADRRMQYFRWSVDSARTLASGTPAAVERHEQLVAALAAVDPTRPLPSQLTRAWRAGVRPWTTQHGIGLVGSLARNLRHRPG